MTTLQIQNTLEEIKKLLNEKNKEEAISLYKENKEELDKYLEGLKYENVEWHLYRWYNLLFLTFFKKPWTFGTFNQWKTKNRKVKKWSKWSAIYVPIFKKKEKEGEKETIKFMKQVYVFHKEDTEEVE